MLEAEVAVIEESDDRFALRTADGDAIEVRRVVLATGVADTLPDVPGLADLWGDLVAHCPYCHGHEFSGRPVGLLGADASVPLRAALLERIASHRVVLTHGVDLDPDVADALKRMDVEMRTEPVLGVHRGALGLDVSLDSPDGPGSVALGGLFVHTTWAPTAPFADQLGLDRSPVGAVVVDGFGRTSRRGVYAAGDVAQPAGLPMPMSSVLAAAAGGQVAAASCDRELAAEDNGIVLPF
jgi:thioredoxin reductase